MKKILTILSLAMMVIFTACNNQKSSNELGEEDIQDKCYKIAKQYAKDKNFEMKGYEDVFFQVVPRYCMDSILKTYDDRYNSYQHLYIDLVKNKQSIFYRWIPDYDFKKYIVFCYIEDAYLHNEKFSNGDLELIDSLYNWMNDFYTEIDTCSKTLIGYVGIWAYNITKDGMKQTKKYTVFIPNFDNFNMNLVGINECGSEDYVTTNEELMKIIKLYYTYSNEIGYEVIDLITSKEDYNKDFNRMKQILISNNMLSE